MLDQIEYLCTKIHNDEWSGPLFFNINGDFESGDFSIDVVDIFPMHKGSSAYTEYDVNEVIVEYQMNHPELLQGTYGNIHSHNNMGTFFSGTDNSDLQENARHHNFYLSLIVNNKLDATAKIGFIGTEVIEKKVWRSFFGTKGKANQTSNDEKEEREVLFVYNCKVNFELPDLDVTDEFKTRVDEIIAAARPVVTHTQPTSYSLTKKEVTDGEPSEHEILNFIKKILVEEADLEEALDGREFMYEIEVALETHFEGLTDKNRKHEIKVLADSIYAAAYTEFKVRFANSEKFISGVEHVLTIYPSKKNGVLAEVRDVYAKEARMYLNYDFD